MASRLAEYLGPKSARAAVRPFSMENLELSPEDLRPRDVPRLFDALRPILFTLFGPAIAGELFDPLVGEFP